jgi:hypothetical protein
MATAVAPARNAEQAVAVERAKLLTNGKLLEAVSFIGDIAKKLRPSLIKVGGAFDQIHRIAGDNWTWWLSNHCEQQTGISPTCAKQYERMFYETRLQTENNPVAQRVFEQADTSKPGNIDALNKALESKSVQREITEAGNDPVKVQAVVESVISKADAKPVPTTRTEAERFDSVFERLENLFSGVQLPINASKTQIAESRRLAHVFQVRVEGLAETLHLEEAGYSLTIRPTRG